MIQTAARLLHKKGYHAMALSEVVQLSGAPRGSLYYYFPGGKDQLSKESIDWSRTRLIAHFRERMQQAPDGVSAVVALVDEAIAQLQATNYLYGCPFSISGLESSHENEELRQACAAAYSEVQDLIREHLGRSLPPERSQTLAPWVFAAFQGALVVSQTRRELSTLEALKSELPKLLEH